MATVEERVNKLENMMMRVLYVQQQTQIEIQELKNEMKEFKNEMRQTITKMEKDTENLKNEMKEFKNEMKEFKNEMRKTITEMKQDTQKFKDEMKQTITEMKQDTNDFKIEMKAEIRRMNKQWGELANKMGTLVEDIVYPATRPVLEKYFKCEISQIMANIKKKLNNFKDEFDIIAVSDKCKKVFLVEVKATIRDNHIKEWIFIKIESLKQLFPEYADFEIIPVLATLRIDEDKLNLANKHKVYIMAYREWEYMDLLNFNEVKR